MRPLGPYMIRGLDWHFGEIESFVGRATGLMTISFDNSMESLAAQL